MPRAALGVAAACIALLAVARLHEPAYQDAPADRSSAPVATPPGITLQLRTITKRVRVATVAQCVYADARGMSLYTLDKNAAPGVSDCTGDCATAWPAALAPPTAKSDAVWSLHQRADGSRQWVLRGEPLYRFANDKEIGDTSGDGIDGVWHAAVFRPDAGVALPDGIAVADIADAGGAGLVDSLGMTLYLANADAAPAAPACGAPACARLWTPLQAPAIANAIGEFSVLARSDGISQWTFRGKALYRFEGDRKPGDVNGLGIDSGLRAALIVRYFMPADAVIRRTLEFGSILSTSSGATLYQRDRVTGEQELHQFRTDHGSPVLGRSFGTATCDVRCARDWPPFIAPAGALPRGFWDIAVRSDGRRQWVFKGFALYTYTADKPGETGGNGHYTLQAIDAPPAGAGPHAPVSGAAAGAGLGAMFWHAVVP